MRLFVAVEVPDAWRSVASAATEVIARASNVSMRLVHPSLMHITLRFLGEVPEERLGDLLAALAHRLPPVGVSLSLGAPSTFGPPTRTQVVWLGVRGDIDGLRALVRRTDLALADARVEVADHRFAPHLTLARLDRTATAEERRLVAELVGAMPPPEPFAFRVRSVSLVRSTLGGPRPVYDTIERFP